jgi:hypothetical protein
MFGIQCTNSTTGELTLSSEAYTFGYLGKATFVSTTPAQNVDSLSSTSGYSTWTFASAGPILVALGLKSSGQSGVSLLGMSKSGSTWTIIVYDGGSGTVSPSSGGTYDAQNTTTDVYVFGFPASLPAYGVALYNAAGTLTGDLSRLPLTPAARISLADSVLAATIPVLTKPAIIGHPIYIQKNSVPVGIRYQNTGYKGVWHWVGDNQIYRADYLDSYEDSDSSVPTIVNKAPCSAILIEANGLI